MRAPASQQPPCQAVLPAVVKAAIYRGRSEGCVLLPVWGNGLPGSGRPRETYCLTSRSRLQLHCARPGAQRCPSQSSLQIAENTADTIGFLDPMMHRRVRIGVTKDEWVTVRRLSCLIKATVFGFLGAIGAVAPYQSAAQPAPPNEAASNPIALTVTLSLNSFEERVQTALEEKVAPGFVFAVIEDGKIIFAQGYGYADLEAAVPATPDTVFPLGSISKTFIGSAAAIATNDGRFDPEEPIANYLSFSIDDPRDGGENVSFLHLATHTSGIVDHDPSYEKAYAFGEAVHPLNLSAYLQSYLTADGELYSAADNFSDHYPGRSNAYSNIASGLAAQALEDKLSVKFEDFTQAEIFGPLGMSSTTWFLPRADPERTATLYELVDGEFTPYPVYALATWPDGGLRSSAHDLARYMIAYSNNGMIDGEQIIPRSAVQMALAGLDMSGVEDRSEDEVATGFFWGTSLAPSALQSRPLIGHNGADPGIWTIMQYDPVRDRGVIAFANGELATGAQIRGFYSLAYSLFLTEL